MIAEWRIIERIIPIIFINPVNLQIKAAIAWQAHIPVDQGQVSGIGINMFKTKIRYLLPKGYLARIGDFIGKHQRRGET